jgi:hypothetical protein
VKEHENCCSTCTVSWAGQSRVTDNGWFDEPLAAGSDGAGAVDGVAGAVHVAGAEEAGDPAGLVAGPADAGHVAGPGDFACCPGLGATLAAARCDGAVDLIAGGIDATAVVIGASADGVSPAGLAAAACWAEPVKLAWVALPVGVAAQAVAPRAAARSAAAPVTVPILRLRPKPGASFPSRSPGAVGVLMGLLE